MYGVVSRLSNYPGLINFNENASIIKIMEPVFPGCRPYNFARWVRQCSRLRTGVSIEGGDDQDGFDGGGRSGKSPFSD